MMRLLAFVLISLLAGLNPVLADHQYNACFAKHADGTIEAQGNCATDFMQRSDKQLNIAWKGLYAQLQDENPAAQESRRLLLIEQRAWIAFKEKNCHIYTQDFGILGKKFLLPLCKAHENENRIKLLDTDYSTPASTLEAVNKITGSYHHCLQDNEKQDVDEQRECGENYLGDMDALLNRNWRNFNAEIDDKKFKARLLTEQRLWIAYKEATCIYLTTGALGRNGDLYQSYQCKTNVIRQRIEQIEQFQRDWIEQHLPD